MTLLTDWSEFDTFLGAFDLPYEDTFKDTFMRSRNVLSGRPIEQINLIAEGATWIVDTCINDLVENEDHPWQNDTQYPVTRISWPRMLWLCKGHFDLSEQDGLDGVGWADYFAVLGIQQFKNSMRALDDNGCMRVEKNPLRFAMCMMDAAEAVTLAEVMLKQLPIEETVTRHQQQTQHYKLSRRKAGVARHAKTEEALVALVDYYQSGTFKSYGEAVNRFNNDYPALVEHLTPTNRERTLRENLSKIIRGERQLRCG